MPRRESMRIILSFSLALLLAVSGCVRSGTEQEPRSAQTDNAAKPAGQPAPAEQSASASRGMLPANFSLEAGAEPGSLSQAFAPERKIIRNADITVEIDAPAAGQHKITAIAESLGGFVVTSEFRQQDARGQASPSEVVKVVVRVPASEFNPALEQVRGVGRRVLQEKVTGQDVTEEYIDLEARIRTKKALEAQFLEIMKRASKVTDALEVQTQLAEVRTEIERLEGRRRFLENQSSLSTITVTLQMPQPLVTATTSGFGHEIKEAFGDGVDTAAAIVTGLIRLLIVLVPVALLILLPLAVLFRFLLRRLRLQRKEPIAEA
jgi:hypothetical protein